MITFKEINNLPTNDVEGVRSICDDVLSDRLATEPMTYARLVAYKSRVNSQKFSPYFEREWKKFMGLRSYGSSIYGMFDGQDESNKTYESKYATYSDKRGASFPQMIRLDREPDEYFIAIFYGDDIEIYRVSGKSMHDSIIRTNATFAHNGDVNELRINIKLNTPEMDFLKKYRDESVEKLFKEHIFSAP